MQGNNDKWWLQDPTIQGMYSGGDYKKIQQQNNPMMFLDQLMNPQLSQGTMNQNQIDSSGLYSPVGGKKQLSKEEIQQMLDARRQDAFKSSLQNKGVEMAMSHSKAKDVTGEAQKNLASIMGMVGRKRREQPQFQAMQMPMHPGILNLLGG